MDVLDGRSRAVVESIAAIVPVRDLALSVAFYERLGFISELYEDGSSYAFLFRGEHSLHLSQLKRGGVDL